MITLQNSQPVEGNPELRVLVDTGTYDETDLIECYHVDNPSIPYCMMQAQRIKFGDLVYHQDVPLTDEQVAAVEAGEAVSEVVAHERFKDGLKKKRKRAGRVISKRGPNKGLSKDEIKQARQESLEEQTATTTATSTDPVVNETPQPNPTPTPTTPNPTGTGTSTTGTSTTTNPVLPDETSTTTPPVIDPPTPDETATSTEPIIPEETATTTEPVVETPVIDTNTSTPPVVETASSTQTLISRIRSKKTTGKIASRIVSKLKKL